MVHKLLFAARMCRVNESLMFSLKHRQDLQQYPNLLIEILLSLPGRKIKIRPNSSAPQKINTAIYIAVSKVAREVFTKYLFHVKCRLVSPFLSYLMTGRAWWSFQSPLKQYRAPAKGEDFR